MGNTDPLQVYAAIAAAPPVKFDRKHSELFEQHVEYLKDVWFPTYNVNTDKEKLTFTFNCVEPELLSDIRSAARKNASAEDAAKSLPELLTWDTFKAYLLKTRPTGFVVSQPVKVMHIKQYPNEELTRYIDRFRTLAMSIPDDECAGRTKSLLFLQGLENQDGLGEPAYRKLIKPLQDNITELEQRQVASLASKQNARTHARTPTKPSHPPKPWQNPKKAHLNNVQGNLLKFIPKTPGAEPTDARNTIWCGWCGKFRDHTSEKCRRNPNPSKGVRSPNAQA